MGLEKRTNKDCHKQRVCSEKANLGIITQMNGRLGSIFTKKPTDGPLEHGFDYSYTILPASLDMEHIAFGKWCLNELPNNHDTYW